MFLKKKLGVNKKWYSHKKQWNMYLLILFRWHYEPLRKFASSMEFSPQLCFFLPLISLFNFAFINMYAEWNRDGLV
jgi:hypothetical protein